MNDEDVKVSPAKVRYENALLIQDRYHIISWVVVAIVFALVVMGWAQIWARVSEKQAAERTAQIKLCLEKNGTWIGTEPGHCVAVPVVIEGGSGK